MENKKYFVNKTKTWLFNGNGKKRIDYKVNFHIKTQVFLRRASTKLQVNIWIQIDRKCSQWMEDILICRSKTLQINKTCLYWQPDNKESKRRKTKCLMTINLNLHIRLKIKLTIYQWIYLCQTWEFSLSITSMDIRHRNQRWNWPISKLINLTKAILTWPTRVQIVAVNIFFSWTIRKTFMAIIKWYLFRKPLTVKDYSAKGRVPRAY